MRVLGLGVILMIAFAVLGIDVGESLRLGVITDGEANAKRHHKHHRKPAHHHRRHKHHHRAPATEM